MDGLMMKAMSNGLKKISNERNVVTQVRNIAPANKNTDKINQCIDGLWNCPKLQGKVRDKLNKLDAIDPKRAENFGLYLIDRYWGSEALERIIRRYNNCNNVLPKNINYFV